MAGVCGYKGGATDGESSDRQGPPDSVMLEELKDLGF